MKNLKPSGRIKRHYILIGSSSREEAEKIILDYIGILGWAKASPVFLEKKEKIILAVERKSVNYVRAAFEAAGKGEILRVSGTLKGLEK